MIPTFQPGDHVLTFNWIRPVSGDVIVFEKGGKNYIKRIKNISGNRYYIGGDNRQNSVMMGSVTWQMIVGKVIFKY